MGSTINRSVVYVMIQSVLLLSILILGMLSKIALDNRNYYGVGWCVLVAFVLGVAYVNVGI